MRAGFPRYLWLLPLALVVGVVAANAFELLRGDRHEARASVLLSESDLALSLSPSGELRPPSAAEREREKSTELELAASSEIIERTVTRTDGAYGSSADLREQLSVQGNSDDAIVTFIAEGSNRDAAVEIANAAAGSFRAWRREIASQQIDKALGQLQDIDGSRIQLSPEDADALRAELNRRRVLIPGSVTIAQTARATIVTPPDHVAASLLGMLAGAIIGLVAVMAGALIGRGQAAPVSPAEEMGLPVLGAIPATASETTSTTLSATGENDEIFRDIATRLGGVAPSRGASTIALMPAAPGHEAPGVVADIAVALARAGVGTTLVDLYTSGLGAGGVLPIPASAAGIRQIAAGEALLDDVAWSIGLDDGEALTAAQVAERNGHGGPQLQVIPVGVSEGGAPPSEEAMRRLIDDQRGRCQWLVLSSPPMVGVDLLPALEADAIVLLARDSRAGRRDVAQTTARLTEIGSRPLGVVLTRARHRS